ncbi:MAG: hypothetical protein KDK36_14120 [Leptospiraceae bacterium]|nr:hypothetical protein [Leptospiraceae bacterium]
MTPESILHDRIKKDRFLYFGLIPIPFIASIVGLIFYFFVIDSQNSETRSLLVLSLIFFILPPLAFIEYFIRERKINKLMESFKNPPGELIWVFFELSSASMSGVKYAQFIIFYFYFNNGKGGHFGVSRDQANFLLNFFLKNCPSVSYGWSQDVYKRFKKNPKILLTNKFQSSEVRYRNVRARV